MTGPAQAAPDIPELPQRSRADVLAGRLRISLAGKPYVLPVLTIRQNEEWVASLTAEVAPLIAGTDDTDEAIRLMEAFGSRLMDFVRSYDITGVLPPPGDWEKDIYPHELLLAVMEVRLAMDPTLSYGVAIAVEDVLKQTTATTAIARAQRSGRTSSSRRPTAGRSRKSAKR